MDETMMQDECSNLFLGAGMFLVAVFGYKKKDA